MADKILGRRCPYARECKIFNGEEEVNNTPLFLYRNVFCNRGEKGWKNCKQYIKYKIEESNA